MFPGPQDHTVDRVFIQLKQPRRRPHPDTLNTVELSPTYRLINA
jgi:hypothetical protein